MRNMWEYVDMNLALTPLEQALKVFADYSVGDIGYAEYTAATENILSGFPQERDTFNNITAHFNGDLSAKATKIELDSQDFFKKLLEQEIIICRHWRYLPPFLQQHEFIKILFLYRGTATYLTHGRELNMRKGDLCIIAPNTKHNIFCHDDESILIFVAMRPSIIREAFIDLLSHNDALSEFFFKLLYNRVQESTLVFRTGCSENVQSAFEHMAGEYNQDSPMRIHLVRDWLRLVLSYALKDCGDTTLEFDWPSSNLQANITPILSYMQANYADATLESVAQQFYFSEAYLSRLIKRATGMTFSSLLRSIRMDRASLLLRRVGNTPEQVMHQVGYKDLSYFSRLFEEHTGYTPAAFLKQENRDD
ncbi:MAG: AraC family transcriptional regulator [Oscillospiraceae bacterium]